ncbi:plasmid mobilization relaxosome protein MobC [Chitinophaga silvatica]|uniref:Plasmid mobilization relaxosome protein MobC n=1 Tax=Chitinophaga silvatica TaxID=2282649 RepID=A0A3E1YHA5_9BACT|nr:plasmid mobilization relaxosome protein MobC [Chitinophaga silvatica]RFS26771.1 plasmid mobilization relaxosome protein MobC [Chitinophaga silvatica]
MEKKTNKWISIRTKPGDYDAIYNRFQQTTCRNLSQYARQVLLNKPVVLKYRNQSADEILSALIGIKNEISAIGNNYNQEVKRLHTLKDSPEMLTWILSNELRHKQLLDFIRDIFFKLEKIHESCMQK